jgi:phosphoglycerate dehydrogenase-like enzyme
LIVLKILVVNPGLAERLSQHLPQDMEIITPETGTDEELIQLAGDVEVILATRLSPDVVEAAPRLKLLQKTGAGVDDMPFAALDEDIWMANTSGANPRPLAEGAVALVMALAKKIPQKQAGFRGGERGIRGTLLQDKKAGIIGYGSIGREIGRILQGLDMEVMAIKRRPDEELKRRMNLEFLGTPDQIKTVMAESDFVIVIAPLTPETRGLVGEEELRAMKPSAYIINVARAALIQEEPLYRALTEGWIAGAAIDVWWTPHWWDPLWNPEGKDASEYPFWELDNVICTPHNIGFTDARSDAGLKIMVENIMRVRDGKPPINQVDKEHQY